MSKIVVVNELSVDGYTEGPGGDVMAMPMDLAFDSHNAERLRAASSLLFGGTTYRGMVSFWPGEVGVADRPDGHRYIAQRYADGIPVTVVSDTVTEADTGPWRDQTTIVRRADAHAHVAAMRAKEGGDAVIYGLNSAGTSADHVAIVVSYTPGDAGPNVVNGDFGHSSGDDGVHSGSDQITATGTDGISGYVSP